MKLILTGATGFIGKALQKILTQKGYEFIILTRQTPKEKTPNGIRYVQWDPPQAGPWQEAFETTDAIINLAGEPIASKRWTKTQKFKILESRCDATQAIVHGIEKARHKPKLLINASAVGYYGPHGDEEITEKQPAGNDFLAQTCKAWEAHALRAEDFGLRVVRLRIGIVLDQGGGALEKMIPPFRFFFGGPLGNGKQWMSWIHREDVAGMILFALENDQVRGAFNATAPHPVTMKEFAQTLGSLMHRPSFMPVPALALKILLGEMSEMLLTGQKVIPEKALAFGYSFRYPNLKQALEAGLK